ncbi:WD40-repeat-containing domain protein [Naviculisporaceae sp. PSN 640]
MSSFFTNPVGQQKKRKRAVTTSTDTKPKKRVAGAGGSSTSRPKSQSKKKAAERDDSISGSDIESDLSGDEIHEGSGSEASESDAEAETAAEKRLRLAQRYLEKTKQEVDAFGFDAEEIDRDLLAERLEEDVAEAKGRVYRTLAPELDFAKADQIQFRWNSKTVTSVAVCPPYAYTTTKDGYLTKWKIQDLPKDQWPQTTRKKPKKPPAPPKRQPERIRYSRSNPKKSKDKEFKGHTSSILVVRASQDGKFVVTGGADKRLVVHDAETLKPLRAFTQHRDSVTGLAFRRGTNQLFSASKDRTIKVWSLDELAYVETLFGHQDEIVDVDALAPERCVSVGARDRTARYWKVPEESQLVFRGGEKKTTSKKVPAGSAAHEGSMDRVAMIDDDLFVTGSDNGALALWGTHRKKALHVIPYAHGIEPPLKVEEVSADLNADPKKVIPPPQPRGITALRTVPYSDLILSGSWDGVVRVWRLSEDKKKIEPVGVLGKEGPSAFAEEQVNGNTEDMDTTDGQEAEKKKNAEKQIRGIINEIAVFERGDRGKDGVCVVVAMGKEMRLGRWKVIKEGKDGAVIFEIPRLERGHKKQQEDEGVNGVLDEDEE